MFVGDVTTFGNWSEDRAGREEILRRMVVGEVRASTCRRMKVKGVMISD